LARFSHVALARLGVGPFGVDWGQLGLLLLDVLHDQHEFFEGDLSAVVGIEFSD